MPAARPPVRYPGQPAPWWRVLSGLRTRRRRDDEHAREAWHSFADARPADVALGELVLLLVDAGVIRIDLDDDTRRSGTR